jgi:hypothetical protein
VVDGVSLFLEELEVTGDLADAFRDLHVADADLDAFRGAHQHFSENDGRGTRLLDAEYRGSTSRPIDEIDDLVEVRRQHVNVFPIERRHERPVDAVDDLTGEIVGLMLEIFYLRDLRPDLRRTLEHLMQQRG